MSNAYNHCYNAMREEIVKDTSKNPNDVAEINHMSLFCIENEDGSFQEYYFGNPYN